MGRRTRARECAVQMLYQWEMTREPMGRVAAAFWRLRTTADATREMAERLAGGAQAHVAALDREIATCSKNWKLERIALIDRCILRVGAYELIHEPGTPSPVILDEAVELAKRFSEAEAPAFVNGVLDAIMKRVRPARAGGESPSAQEKVRR